MSSAYLMICVRRSGLTLLPQLVSITASLNSASRRCCWYRSAIWKARSRSAGVLLSVSNCSSRLPALALPTAVLFASGLAGMHGLLACGGAAHHEVAATVAAVFARPAPGVPGEAAATAEAVALHQRRLWGQGRAGVAGHGFKCPQHTNE